MWSPRRKLLKTWQLLASCEGGPSPSWRWHLNCPALAHWGRPPATTHTHTLSLVVVKGQTQWHKLRALTFFSLTGAKVNALCTSSTSANTDKPMHIQTHTNCLWIKVPTLHTLSTWSTETILLLIPYFTHKYTHTHTHWSSAIMP